MQHSTLYQGGTTTLGSVLGRFYDQFWISCVAAYGSHVLELTWVSGRLQLGADSTVTRLGAIGVLEGSVLAIKSIPK